MEASLSFETANSPESIRAACLAFREYRAKKYGLLLTLACMFNVAMVAILYWAGADQGAPLLILTLVAVLGPVTLLYEHFARHRVLSLKLGLVLAKEGRCYIGPEGITLPLNGGEIVLPWTTISRVIEKPAFFLLVLSPLSCYPVAKQGMPVAAQDALRARGGESAA